MRYALIRDGVAVEIVPAEGMAPIAERYHPDIAAMIAEVPDEVEAGWRQEDGAWTAPEPVAVPAEQAASLARALRDRLLTASDWTQMPDAPLSEEVRNAWAEYRQALRGVPEQEGFPASIAWPDAPAVALAGVLT